MLPSNGMLPEPEAGQAKVFGEQFRRVITDCTSSWETSYLEVLTSRAYFSVDYSWDKFTCCYYGFLNQEERTQMADQSALLWSVVTHSHAAVSQEIRRKKGSMVAVSYLEKSIALSTYMATLCKLMSQSVHTQCPESLKSYIMWHVDPLPANRCVNRRQYNSHCYGTDLWTRYPGNERIRNKARDVFCGVRVWAI